MRLRLNEKQTAVISELLSRSSFNWPEMYIAGYRAGLEAAAGECDRYAQTFGAPGPWLGGAASCAQAIRSMLNEPIDKGEETAAE